MIRKWYLIPLAIIFLNVAQYIYAPFAHATSVYDDIYSLTNTLEVQDGSSSTSTHIETSWAGLISNWNQIDGIDGMSQSYKDDMTLVSSQFSSATSWAVVEVNYNAPSVAKIVNVYFSDTELETNWVSIYVPGIGTSHRLNFTSSSTIHSVSLYQSYGSNVLDDGTVYPVVNSSPPIVATNSNSVTYEWFIFNGNFVPPPSFEGGTPQDTYTPPEQLQFTWSVREDGTVGAVYNIADLIDTTDVIRNCGLQWTLTDSSNTTLDTQTLGYREHYTYDHLTSTGTYYLKMTVNWCVPFIDDGSFTSQTAKINWTSGKFIASNTSGDRTPQIGGLDYIKHYGLTAFVLAPINGISTIATTSCTTITIPFIQSTSIEIPCLSTIYSQKIPTIITIWHTVLTGLVGYYVVIKIIDRLKRTADPEDSSIEVIKL